MNRKIICNICLSNGNIVEMTAKDGYFQCMECGNESWPDKEGSFVAKWNKQLREYRSCSLPEGVKVHGGAKSGKNPARDKISKKPLSTINARLYESR